MRKIGKWKAVLSAMLAATMLFPMTAFSAEGETKEETKNIHVDVSQTDWGNVNIHFWGGSSESSWPGKAMTDEEGTDKIYTYAIPKDSTGIIFNSDSSGVMKQTVDITDIRDDVTYQVQKSDAKAEVKMLDKDGNVIDAEAPKVDTMSIYFDNSKTNWPKVSIHYWGSGVTGTEWPGAAMTAVEGRENVYKADVPVGITGIVFTNPDDPDNVKSSDVTNIPTKADYEADNTVSAEYISVGVEYGKYAVLRKNADGSVYEPPKDATAEERMAKQVNTHVGADYTSVTLSYTTIAETDTKVVLTDAAGNVKEYTGEGVYSPSAEKFKHTVVLDGLSAATAYTYTIGEGDAAFSGTFRSLPAPGGNETVKFAFLADPQVGNASNAKVANTTFKYLNDMGDLSFVYIGGDITDNSDNKSQWENLYTCDGLNKTGGQDLFSNNLLAVTQGNHDKNNGTSSLSGYITAPNEGGNLVYSVDYGKAKLIVLNLETAKNDDAERESQKAYLEQEVAAAKAAGQWTIVGFHKSIYTGASHIIDSDVVAARKYWSPVLAGLDVDMVLEAHDHVLARGFINGDGTKGGLETDETGAYISKDNAPLYFVGGHAGGLKWYSAKNYTVGEDDPLLPNYEFLDLDSALLGDNATDKTHETMYTIIEASEGELKTTTYAFKYDQDTDEITKAPYVFDSVVVKKTAGSQEDTTTEAPTEEPTTEVPTTEEPTTEAPTTEVPTTEVPTTTITSGQVTTNNDTTTANTAGQNSSTYTAAQTGDNSPIVYMIIVLAAAGVAALTLSAKKKNS